jgi:DNA-binding response OmpR family regulator
VDDLLETKTAIVIDDNVPTADLIGHLLKLQGYEVRAAYDGLQGVEMFRQEPSSLLVTDLRLPGMNGIEVARQVQAIDPAVRVIVNTGLVEEEDRKNARALGAVILQKPLHGQQFLKLVSDLEPNGAEASPSDQAPVS